MKELTVVFPIHINPGGVVKILMGKKAPGTKLAGFRNGYGGKCEEGETPLDCAVREVKEETGLDLEREKVVYIGKIIEGDKHVYFYIYFFDSEIYLPDSEKDFVDNRWFVLENTSEYLPEMIPGNEEMIVQIPGIIDQVLNNEKFTPFVVDLTSNQEAMEVTKQIYGEK
jgi:8-oxo-dGTP pyrophosphatase MutT (NUDIX family)